MTILVTGAAGAIGRLVVQQLVAEGVRVRAVSRSPRDATLPYGVEVVQVDQARPDTTAGHFAGVDAVFLHSRTFGDSADRLLALAAERGVSKVVALSAMNIDDPFDLQPSRRRGDRNKEAEEAAVASGLAWPGLDQPARRQLRRQHPAGVGRPDPRRRRRTLRARGLPGVRARRAGSGPATGEVDKVLGRPARTYDDWVADHIAAFRSG